MRIMSDSLVSGAWKKPGGFAQTIMMSNIPKVDDTWPLHWTPPRSNKPTLGFNIACAQN